MGQKNTTESVSIDKYVKECVLPLQDLRRRGKKEGCWLTAVEGVKTTWTILIALSLQRQLEAPRV